MTKKVLVLAFAIIAGMQFSFAQNSGRRRGNHTTFQR